MSCESSYASPTVATPAHPIITVVGPEFMAAYPVDMVITKKVMTLREGSFDVTDYNGNIVFTVKGSVFNHRHTWVLLDAADRPIVTLRQTIFTICEAYRGNSSNPKDLLFIVKKSSHRLNVYLPNKEVPDFKIEAHAIYHGDSYDPIAEMMEKYNSLRSMIGKDTYAVSANANIDHAFVVSLFMAHYAIEESSGFSSFFKSVLMCGSALCFADAMT